MTTTKLSEGGAAVKVPTHDPFGMPLNPADLVTDGVGDFDAWAWLWELPPAEREAFERWGNGQDSDGE